MSSDNTALLPSVVSLSVLCLFVCFSFCGLFVSLFMSSDNTYPLLSLVSLSAFMGVFCFSCFFIL